MKGRWNVSETKGRDPFQCFMLGLGLGWLLANVVGLILFMRVERRPIKP